MSERRLVGTAEGCDLRVSDAPYMSNRHFYIIQREDGALFVEDAGSTNGTTVWNGAGWVRAFGPVPIGPGAKVHAGRVLFKIGADGHVTAHKDVSLLERDTV